MLMLMSFRSVTALAQVFERVWGGYVATLGWARGGRKERKGWGERGIESVG